jgi:hypothetical protein
MLRVFVVEHPTDDDEVRDLFIRLQAGTALSRQQIRDAWPGQMAPFVESIGGKGRHGPKFGLLNMVDKRGGREGEDDARDPWVSHRQTCAQLLSVFLARSRDPYARPKISAEDLDELYHETSTFDPTGVSARRRFKEALNTTERVFQIAAAKHDKKNKSKWRKVQVFSVFLVVVDMQNSLAVPIIDQNLRRLSDVMTSLEEALKQTQQRFSSAAIDKVSVLLREAFFAQAGRLDPNRSFSTEQKEELWKRASVTQNFSTADAMGRLTLNMLMSFAEFEREMIGERTRDKMTAARRRGKWTGGPIPLGYDVIEKKLVVNNFEAVLVRDVFGLYLENRSALAVARELNARHQSTKSGHAWTKSDVLRVLRNPVYGGFMGCGAELHTGEHAAIIDAEVFEKARAILGENGGARGTSGRNPDYLLRGLLFCGSCGAAFTPASTRRSGREYRYYRCVTRDKKGKEACPSAPLPTKAIEEFVIERIREVTRDKQLAAEVADSVKVRLEAKRVDLLTVRQKLPAEIAALAAEGKRLVVSLEKVKGAGARLVEERIQEVGERLSRTEAQLAEVEREIANLDAAEVEAGWVARCLEQFDAVWDALTPESRVRFVRTVVERVEVDEPSNEVTVRLADISVETTEQQEVEAA